jgi:endonuclease III
MRREVLRSVSMNPANAAKILGILKKTYPDARCELNFSNPLELLVATILSAQCTDVRVNAVTKSLFKKYRKAEDYLKARPSDLEKEIRPTGFFKNKTKSIQGCCKVLVEKHGGKVPTTTEELTALPGVGRKTANVVLGNAYGIPGITCDTHVIRLSERLGLSKQKDPVKLEFELQKLIPQKDWTKASHILIWHGRRCCYARKPDCPLCPVATLCPYPHKTPST